MAMKPIHIELDKEQMEAIAPIMMALRNSTHGTQATLGQLYDDGCGAWFTLLTPEESITIQRALNSLRAQETSRG